MALSDADVARARKHLGYTAARPVGSYAFGFPVLTEPQFLFEQSMKTLVPANEPDVVRMLDVLDQILCRQEAVAMDGAPAEKAEGITPNLNEPDWIEKEYVRFGKRLAEMLGCPVCPWATRFQESESGGMTGNIRVR